MPQPTAEQKLQHTEAVFAALAHAARRQMLLTVWFRGGMTAGDIAGRFSHSWPTTSRHLRVLERAELLTHEKQGRKRAYHVNLRRLALVKEWLAWFEKGDKR